MIIFDLEIKKAILSRGETEQKGIEYCDGWHDHKNMGVSCLCTYDYDQDRYQVFCDDNMDKFIELAVSTDLLVGFNNIRFDNSVLYALDVFDDNSGTNFDIKSYDILREIWRAAGLGSTFQYGTHGGYGLNNMVKANFPNCGKTGHGAYAPIQYQRGEWGALISYCLDDVRLTKRLFDLILTEQTLLNPVGKNPLKLRMPKEESK